LIRFRLPIHGDPPHVDDDRIRATGLQRRQRAAADQAQLRDLKLAERGNGFELRASACWNWPLEEGAITVKLARRLSMTPEWDTQTVKSGADQRKLLDEVKRRLERWQRED
jgi:hypothetical protein